MSVTKVVQAPIESSLPWQVVGTWFPCLHASLAGILGLRRNAFATALATEVAALGGSLAQHLRHSSRRSGLLLDHTAGLCRNQRSGFCGWRTKFGGDWGCGECRGPRESRGQSGCMLPGLLCRPTEHDWSAECIGASLKFPSTYPSLRLCCPSTYSDETALDIHTQQWRKNLYNSVTDVSYRILSPLHQQHRSTIRYY